METLEFYDVKSKRKFKTDKYEIRKRDVKGKPRYFANPLQVLMNAGE